ncbi:MAG: HD domain-containing protein [Deltaproteobacteria bacterium]|jgi:putative nucleotidyltransferase with HDIG domain|nr:HD domain-containing protein [Deltaproteobacteria bacterium]
MEPNQFNAVAQALSGAVKSLHLYAADHPATARQIETLQNGLFHLLQNKETIRIGTLERTLFIDDHLFVQELAAAEEVAKLLEKFGLIGLEFKSGLTADEVKYLLRQFQDQALKGEEFAEILLKGSKHIRAIAAEDEDDDQKPHKVYQKALKVVDQIFRDVRMGEIPSSSEAIKVVKSLAQLTITEPNAMMALSMLKDYDNYTFTHSVNVSVLALAVGRACRLAEEQLRVVGLGGLLHDLGKLRVDVKIVTKPGKLSQQELVAMKEHPRFGAEIVEQMDGVTHEVTDIVMGHHRCYDGTGYPDWPTDKALSPLVEMASIADSYDAMTTLRCYQRPYTPRKATARLKEISGSVLHPEYVSRFIESLGPYPVGSLVRLNNNEVGLVTKVDTKDPAQTEVKIIYSTEGVKIAEPYQRNLNPSEPLRIIAEVDPHTRGLNVTDFFDYA